MSRPGPACLVVCGTMDDAAAPASLDRRLRPPTLRVSLLIGAGLIVATVLYLGRDALGPFILGLFLVYLLDPVVTFLQGRLRVPRGLAVLAIYAVVVVIIALVIRVTIPALVEQISRLLSQLPELLRSWIDAIEQAIADLDLLPPQLRADLLAALEELRRSILDQSGNLDLSKLLALLRLADLAGPVASIVSAVFAYLILPIFIFYLLKDRPVIVRAVRAATPDEWEPDLASMATIVDRVFIRWLRGQLLLGLAVGLATFIGLEAIALVGIAPVFADFAILLAIIAGVLELVPIIGPIISAIPIVLIGASDGLQGALAGLLLAFAVQQVENNLLVPKIQSDATDLHPSVVIAGIVIGGSIGGILGAILALPVTAAFRDVVRYLFRRLGPEPIDANTALALAIRPDAVHTIRSPTPSTAAPSPPGDDDATTTPAGSAKTPAEPATAPAPRPPPDASTPAEPRDG